MQLSTAISDGTLAVASLVACMLLFGCGRRWCAVWMGAIALAALAGTVRFAGVDEVVPLHAALSQWAAFVALPSFCWAMTRYLYSGRDVRAGESLAIAAALNLALLIASDTDTATAIGAVALIVAFFGAMTQFKSARTVFLLIAWAIGFYAVAGLSIGVVGVLGPMLRVDIYHYLLAAANLLFGAALWLQRRLAAGS